MDDGSLFEILGNVFAGGVLVAFVAAGLWFARRQQQQAASGAGPYADAARALQDALSQRLGYRATGPAPAAGQVLDGQPMRTDFTRAVGDRSLRWTSETRHTGTAMQLSMQWTLALAAPARVPLHLLSSRLVNLGGAASDALFGRSRTAAPRYPSAVPVTTPGIAGKVVAYTAPGFEQAAGAVLADPELAGLLSQLAHVDLLVEPATVRFDDPFQENLIALMGGPMGMASALTPQGIERTLWMHEALARALSRAADLVR